MISRWRPKFRTCTAVGLLAPVMLVGSAGCLLEEALFDGLYDGITSTVVTWMLSAVPNAAP